MSNLVPEKRIDKNGRAITRHVKLPAPPSGSGLFAPLNTRLSSAVIEGQSEASALLMRALFVPSSYDPEIYLRPDGKEVSAGLIALLRAIPSDTMSAVSERVTSLSSQESSVVSETLMEIDKRSNTHNWEPEFAESLLHYSVELAPCMVAYSEAGTSDFIMHNSVMHVHAQVAAVFRGREPRLLFADEAEKEVIRGAAVNHLLTGAYFETKNVLTLSWIGRNLDRIEGYKEVIRARGTMNRELVEEIMRADSPSLAGGYL